MLHGSAVSACCAHVVNKIDAFTNMLLGQLADWYMGSESLLFKDELPVGIPEHECTNACACSFHPQGK